LSLSSEFVAKNPTPSDFPPPSYSVASTTETFTFICVLSATSNLDHFIASFSSETVKVISDGFYLDHLPIKLKINALFNVSKQPDKNWFYIKD